MNFHLLIFISIFLLSACGPVIHLVNPPDTREVSIPPQVQVNKTPNITIMRLADTLGDTRLLYPSLNETTIAGLYYRDYLQFSLDANNYQLGVWCEVSYAKWTHQFIEIQVNPDKKYCFSITGNPKCASIKETTCDAIASDIKKGQQIEVGKISKCGDSEEAKSVCFRNAL